MGKMWCKCWCELWRIFELLFFLAFPKSILLLIGLVLEYFGCFVPSKFGVCLGSLEFFFITINVCFLYVLINSSNRASMGCQIAESKPVKLFGVNKNYFWLGFSNLILKVDLNWLKDAASKGNFAFLVNRIRAHFKFSNYNHNLNYSK